ncbi:pyruvate formate lyase family protein [Chloroflexota bacterium]
MTTTKRNWENRVTLEMRKDTEFYGSKGCFKILPAERELSRNPYNEGATLDVERPRLYCESYKATEGEPMVIRRGKALAHLLDNKAVYILPRERIVGNVTNKPMALITYPELWWRWLDKAIDTDYRTLVTDEEREEMHEIHKYFAKYGVHGMERDLLPEDIVTYWRYDVHGAFSWIHGGRTGVPDYEKVFKLGLKGIIKQIDDRLKELDESGLILRDARSYLEQKDFLRAAKISLEAGCRFGKRFAQKCREEADIEEDEDRKKELEEMADVCDWVPENPCRTLHDAIQCYWFIKIITHAIDLQTPGGGERLDQILYPYYKKDKEEGRLTRQEAQELVEHVLLKHNEEGQLSPPRKSSSRSFEKEEGGTGGGKVGSRVTNIGGTTADGKDATNEMSYIILDAFQAIKLSQPSVVVRLHKNTPHEFLSALTDHLKVASGVTSIFNDEMMVPYLTNKGIPVEDARLYSTHGCMRWNISAKAINQRALGGVLVTPKLLEYALNQGWNKFTGRQIGAPTPDPTTFTCLEDMMQAYETQARFFLEKQLAIYNLVDVLDSRYLQQPFYSALLEGCIERGQDCRDYKYYADTVIQPMGQINCINSLAAIKKLVFDEKKYTMAELVEALQNNWEGKEEMRQDFANCPHWGNDDDYVDAIGRNFYRRNTELVHSFKNIWGFEHAEDGTAGASFYQWSGLTGAAPDGRKDRDLFADGTISPAIGTDLKGPTAVLKSVAKADHAHTFSHLLNQRFLPQFLEGENKEAFISYLRSFVDLKIHHVQFNIVDNKLLLDAQEHPEEHVDLVVRVAGFSAYFVGLPKPVQDQIISRTVHVGI